MNTKIRCLLLDDELPGLTYLKMMCAQIPELEIVKAFNDPVKLLQESKQLDFDLAIIDVEMPGLSGLEVAQSLAGKAIIFTTAYKEYAAEAFDLNAVDYVRKPVQKERLEKAIQKAVDKISSKTTEKQFIQLNTSKGKSRLFFDQLLFITSSPTDKRDKIAVLEKDETLLLKNVSFTQLLSALPASHFCRISKKEIIALKIVSFFSHEEISTSVIKDGKPLSFTLSDTYKPGFLEKTSA